MRAAATDLHDGQCQHRRLMVCGDLKDVPEAATTQILSGLPGSEIGTNGYDQPDRGHGQRLWNPPSAFRTATVQPALPGRAGYQRKRVILGSLGRILGSLGS